MVYVAVFYLCLGTNCGFVYTDPVRTQEECVSELEQGSQELLRAGADTVEGGCVEVPVGTNGKLPRGV